MFTLITYLLISFAIICLVWYGLFFLYLRPFRCNVPGPLPLPLIGNWLNLVWPRRPTLEPSGHRSIECYWLGVLGIKPFVFVCDPELVREIAIDRRDDLHDRGTRDLVGFMAGASKQSILTTRGETWRHQKKKMSPILSSPIIADTIFEGFLNEAPSLIEALDGGKVVCASEVIYQEIDRIAAKCMFGFEDPTIVERFTRRGSECQRKDRAWSYWSALASLPFLPTAWWRRLSGVPLVRQLTSHNEMESMHQDHCQMTREQLQKVADQSEAPPVLKAILELAHEEAQRGTAKKIIDESTISNIVALANGASKNEAAIVCYGLQELAKNPEAQQKLANEIDAILGGSPPTSREQLLSMPYLEAVTNELLRLRPGFPVLSKIAERKTILGGYTLGRGVEVAVRLRTLQSHPKYWERADEFYPERHLDGSASSRPPYVFIPFGIGRRKCPGSVIARVEIALTLCLIVQRFRVLLPEGILQPEELTSLAIGLSDAIKLRFVNRQPNGRKREKGAESALSKTHAC